MENATKALLIAAAILIAIILISMGIAVVRQGQEAVQSVDMSEAEILAHNSKFTSYEGTNVAGSEVNVLLGIVLTHNQQADTGAQVEVKLPTGATSGISQATNATTASRAVATARYEVKCVLTNGLVSTIEIKAK